MLTILPCVPSPRAAVNVSQSHSCNTVQCGTPTPETARTLRWCCRCSSHTCRPRSCCSTRAPETTWRDSSPTQVSWGHECVKWCTNYVRLHGHIIVRYSYYESVYEHKVFPHIAHSAEVKVTKYSKRWCSWCLQKRIKATGKIHFEFRLRIVRCHGGDISGVKEKETWPHIINTWKRDFYLVATCC